jgi:hypothetical protein
MNSEFPPHLVQIVRELRELEAQYVDISYRSGTNGERGLYQKRKSVLSKISKARARFVSDEYRLVQSGSYPRWYISKIIE